MATFCLVVLLAQATRVAAAPLRHSFLLRDGGARCCCSVPYRSMCVCLYILAEYPRSENNIKKMNRRIQPNTTRHDDLLRIVAIAWEGECRASLSVPRYWNGKLIATDHHVLDRDEIAASGDHRGPFVRSRRPD